MLTFPLLLSTGWLLVGPSIHTDAPPANPAAIEIAHLRIVAVDGEYQAWAENLLAGPVEVRLTANGPPPAWSQPALPARASVPAGGRVLLAHLRATGGTGKLALHLDGAPGSSNARPQDVTYLLPLVASNPRVDQGFEGDFSHQDDENRYALDFATPVGTPVVAARGGIVMQVEGHFHGHGLDYVHDAGRANFIRILHDDGSMALYAHLAEAGVQVQVGQRVATGQRIGLSGNTGYSTAPHLHFAVQVNRSMQLYAIPFRLAEPAASPNPSR